MTAYVVSEGTYHRGVSDGLPHPSEALTVSEIREEQERVIDVLEQGGAVIVLTDDGARRLGVLTRQQPLLDEASIAAQIDSGRLPPIADLIAMDDRGELP
jgi:hypothetical protein